MTVQIPTLITTKNYKVQDYLEDFMSNSDTMITTYFLNGG